MSHKTNVDICKGTKENSEQCQQCGIRDSLLRNRHRVPKTHYLMIVICDNCEYPNLITIPKGTKVVEFIENLDCTYCLCRLEDVGIELFDDK